MNSFGCGGADDASWARYHALLQCLTLLYVLYVCIYLCMYVNVCKDGEKGFELWSLCHNFRGLLL